MEQSVRSIILDEEGLPRLERCDPTAEPENAFEQVALRILRRLYPSCYVFAFKALVQYNGTGWRADLAVVDRKMGFWFVIEVEIAMHSLQRHVLPQVIALRDGDYGVEAIQRLSENVHITCPEAATLVRHIPRYVAVVSNTDNAVWEGALAAENIQYISISSFERTMGTFAYLTAGVLKPAEWSVSFGVAIASTQSIMVKADAFWRSGAYRIVEPGGSSVWDCTVQDSVAWLTKQRGVLTLPDRTIVQFLAQDDGTLLIRIP